VPPVENVPSSAASCCRRTARAHAGDAGGIEICRVPALETTLKIEEARASNNPFNPIIVKEGLSQADARVREQLAHLPGTQVLVEAVRRYTAGEVTRRDFVTRAASTKRSSPS
jgi:hypothetical protein